MEIMHTASTYQRKRVFRKILVDIDTKFLQGWFMQEGAQCQDFTLIKRENLVEWIAWAFFRANVIQNHEINEINSMVERIEESIGHKLDLGYNSDLETIRLGLNKVEAGHRPFILYACICVLEMMGYCALVIMGYRFSMSLIW
jgi:hypothetical protein